MLWPHSPAIALGPLHRRRLTTMPPPVPVITPNTVVPLAPAPSVASDRVKQSASLATRTGRLSERSTSRTNGLPLSQTELAFLIRPVAGETAPGMPMPTRQQALIFDS